MTWSYGLGKIGKKIYLCEIVVPEDKRKNPWGYRVSWFDALRHPIMVISDLLDQKKHLGIVFPIDKLEKNMIKYFNKIIPKDL